MRTYNLCLVGFGNVAQALVRVLRAKSDELQERYGIGWRVTGPARAAWAGWRTGRAWTWTRCWQAVRLPVP